MKPYLIYYQVSGKLWPAGDHIYGLCSAWNFATNPARPMNDTDHSRACTYARAIKNRMSKLGFVEGKHYRELSNGILWPLERK